MPAVDPLAAAAAASSRASDAAAAPLVARVPGFAAAVRAFISGVLGRTYRRIARATLAACMGLGAAEAGAWALANGWTAAEGDLLELPVLAENSSRPVKRPGADGLDLKYAEVAAVLGAQLAPR
jgi:hypothetical protein